MKGRLPAEELKDLPVGWGDPEVHALLVPGLDAQRHIVVLKRT
jgi:16S rRNA (guanine527-N7)-methyltransferase